MRRVLATAVAALLLMASSACSDVPSLEKLLGGEPATLEAATAAAQEWSNRRSSGDYAGVWLMYSRQVRDAISQADYVTVSQTCASPLQILPVTATGVRLEGPNTAVVRLQVGQLQHSIRMFYEDGTWVVLPDDPELAAALGKTADEIIASRRAAGNCYGSRSASPPAPTTPLPTTTTTEPSAPYDFTSQPLWPFESQFQADRWFVDDRPQGQGMWHEDAEATARAFTQEFLQFEGIDRITDVDIQGTEAWVGIGYAHPSGKDTTAATIHLVRFGPSARAPWEVVGTRDDDTLTLDRPAYGSTAAAVIDAGGTINGVDEAIHVQVRQSERPEPVGEFCCQMAGGAPDGMRWSARVSVTDVRPAASLTVVAWTGGHVAEVERFAVTGLRSE